jgi:hypothetical protein
LPLTYAGRYGHFRSSRFGCGSGGAVIGKLAIFLAPLIVLAALVLLAGWIGVRVGRVRERARRDAIDPNLFDGLHRWVGEVLSAVASPGLDDDLAVLPERLRAEGARLHQSATRTLTR